jgi:hypothetical protein
MLFQKGLRVLVEYAESCSGVAGLQGVVLKYGSRPLFKEFERVIDCVAKNLWVAELIQHYRWVITLLGLLCYGIEAVAKER